MTRNMGTIDRGVRALIGLALLAWAFLTDATDNAGIVFWIALVVAAVMLVTALVGNCPLYKVLGVDTCGEG